MEHHSYPKLVLYAFLIAFNIYLIIWLKAYTYPGVDVIYIYTILITTFMFSRVLGSFFYESPSIKYQDNNYEPTVSFVIPCKNEQGAICNTITKCFEVDYDKRKIEVIAINDGSTDNTLSEMLRAKSDSRGMNIKIVDWKKNLGKRQGMNAGFRLAKGEIVVQLDSDSYVASDSLRKIVAPFIEKKIAAAVGHTEPSNKNENLITKIQTPYYFMSFRALKATESIFDMVFCCSGCFSAYRKSYVLPVLDNWLKEKFLGKLVTYGDDRALTNQMLKKGYKAIYCYDAKAYTVVPNNIKQFLKQQVRWKKGWFINSVKALKFILKRDKFVALSYFIPLILLTLVTPLIVIKALVINPIFLGIAPYYYIFGIMLVSSLLYLHYKIYSEDRRYGGYMFIWSILNMTMLSYILIYALYDLRNMNWGTR